MLLVQAWDIAGGEDRVDLGEHESIQVTGGLLRGDDDNAILTQDPDTLLWVDADGNAWLDWTATSL